MNDPLNSSDRDWSAPEHSGRTAHLCRGCGAIIGPDEEKYFNGWPWHRDPCYREMVDLSMTPEARELERAARADIERDDFVDDVNRSRR